jgi:cytochrome c oxidase cbb3-type subunit 3
LSCTDLETDGSAPGRALYNARCYFCHGYNGDAATVAAAYLDPSPRDFTKSFDLTLDRIARAVRHGRPRSAMQSFAGLLDDAEIDAVSTYVLDSFVRCATANTRYHSAANGWADHDRKYAVAYPFVLGEKAIPRMAANLEEPTASGLALFKSSCIVCHEGRLEATGEVFEENRSDNSHGDHDEYDDDAYGYGYGHGGDDHDTAPLLLNPTKAEARGEDIYQRDCAYCHAADGTGQNDIGRFLDPHPPDLTNAEVQQTMTESRLRHAITRGLDGTSMPGFGSVLNEEEVDALITYMQRVFAGPLKE